MGTTDDNVVRIGHVSVPDLLRASDGGLDVPGFGHLALGNHRFDSGTLAFVEFERGRPLIATTEYHAASPAPDSAMTFRELHDSVRRMLGVDLPIEPPKGAGPHALRRMVGQNTRQAQHHRDRRIF